MSDGSITFTDVHPLAGMKPWVCSYVGPNGRPNGITLWATSPEQILEDHCEALPGLTIDGVLVATAPAGREDSDR